MKAEATRLRGMKMGAFRASAVLVALAAFAHGCSSRGSDKKAGDDGWICSRFGDDCSCKAKVPGTVYGPRDEVPWCEGDTCCWASDGSGDEFSECDCTNSTACAAEVASRSGARQVASCPPADYVDSIPCATEGENCRSDYLLEKGYFGCCSEMICKTGGAGIPTCQRATGTELEDGRACGHWNRKLVSVLDPIVTDAGHLSVRYVDASSATLGPGNCVAGIELTLEGCRIQVGPARVPSGDYLVATAPDADYSCISAGFGSMIKGTATFTGVSCEAKDFGSGICVAGTVAISVTSQPSPSSSQKTFLTGVPFRVRAEFCPYGPDTAASCTG